MVGWPKERWLGRGCVLQRGIAPPSCAEVRRRLEAAGVRFVETPHPPGIAWTGDLEHPQWGEAGIAASAELPTLSPAAVEFDPRLEPEERAEARRARSAIWVCTPEEEGRALRDRKLLLRFLRALFDPGAEHPLAVDLNSGKLWSRPALDEELCHDADLDVEAAFQVHAIHEGRSRPGVRIRNDRLEQVIPRIHWLHTHGLAELGGFDFDILRPSKLVMLECYDLVRQIAYGLLEGALDPDMPRVTLFLPRGDVAFVPIEEFMQRGPSEERAIRLRRADDPSHDGPRRVILCDPREPADPAREHTGDRPLRAARALQRLSDPAILLRFPPRATALCAERARKTLPLFRDLVAELEDVGIAPTVQIGVRRDEAREDGDREYLWFDLEGFPSADTIEGTLFHEPCFVSGLKPGDRRTFAIEQLGYWRIETPLGRISPHELSTARRLRYALTRMREEEQAGRRAPRSRQRKA